MDVRAQNDLYFENCHAVYKAPLVIVTLSNTNQSKGIIFAPGVRCSASRHHWSALNHLSIYNQAEFSNWKTLNCWYSFCHTFCKSHLKKGKSWTSPFLWLLFWSKCKCVKQIRSLRVTVHNSALFIVVSCWCLWFAACKIRTPMTFPFSI